MRAILGALAAVALFVGAGPVAAQQGSSAPQVTVDAAAATVTELSADSNYGDIRAYIDRAKAVMIIPQLLKAGLIVGGQVGDAVVLSRVPGGWSGPAFYSLAGGSIGLQVGAEAQQVIIAIMTEKGLKQLMANKFELGVDASISVGTVGGGAGASSVGSLKADMVSFSRSKGLFGGGALDGTLIRPQPEKNAAYYGAGTTAEDILIRHSVSNAGSAKLSAALSAR